MFHKKTRLTATAKRKRPLPCETKGAIKMRQEIDEFVRKYQKVAATFSDSNQNYRACKNFLHGEDLFQVAFCAFISCYHPTVSKMHPKNEGKESFSGQAKKRLMGIQKGALDLLLQKEELPDFWMELKRKPNKPTDEQLDFAKRQIALGNNASFAYDLEEAVTQLNDWLSSKK